ncbi:ornithine cyclodeaminase family protein [Thermodesulfobacteriota bacterium]
MTLILSNEQISEILTMAECIDVLEEAYVELAAGRGITRLRSDSLTPAKMPDAFYGLKSMDGVAPKFGVGAVRINSDIITWPEINGKRRRVKVPAAPNRRWVGLVLLFSTETGEPLAIFPDGVVQRARVGATNGLGAKYLAREDAGTIGLLGSGWQAGGQLMAITAVRSIEKVRCFSPTKENRENFCREWSGRLNIEVIPVDSTESAIKGVDIVLCGSSSMDYIFFEKWFKPGMHISSIKLAEIEPAAIQRADIVAIHCRAGMPLYSATSDLSEVEKVRGKGWDVQQSIDFDTLPTLPDLITGKAIGRTSVEQTTCFLNNLGLGYQFAAVGALVYRKAKDQGVGKELPTDWFTEDVHP